VERIGHRGAKRELSENTIPAFQRAFERGADAVELDVHATRDEVVVVHHDPVLGVYAGDLHHRPIADLDWAAVSRVRLAPGVGIPTLEDVLHSMPATGTAYVEIKAIAIEHLVEAALRRADRRCAVHSFDFGIIGRMRDIAPATPRGILLDRAAKDIETLIKAAGARDVWPEWSLIDRALVDRVHRAGSRVIAWTVNSRRGAEQLIAMGVDGLCTDDIRLLDGL